MSEVTYHAQFDVLGGLDLDLGMVVVEQLVVALLHDLDGSRQHHDQAVQRAQHLTLHIEFLLQPEKRSWVWVLEKGVSCPKLKLGWISTVTAHTHSDLIPSATMLGYISYLVALSFCNICIR